MIAIIDYQLGNVKSIQNAMERLEIPYIVTNQKEEIQKASGIILPGVGTFAAAMKNLKNLDLISILKERKDEGIPILGICLGMQILFETGYEVAKVDGLGFLQGKVEKIETEEKLPHMGWNELYFSKENIFQKTIKEGSDVYFVHSYMAKTFEDDVIAYAIYGENRIPAIVGRRNVLGCQFHPEKSGKIGEKILRTWKEMLK